MIIKVPYSKKDVKREHAAHEKKSDPTYSRRELIEKGLAGYTGLLFGTSALSLLARSENAFAASQLPAMVVISLQGGCGFTPEFMGTDTLGNPLTAGSYSIHGVPGFTAVNDADYTYGAPMWKNRPFWNSLSASSAAVKNNLSIGTFTHGHSSDDSANNPYCCSHQIASAVSTLSSTALRSPSGIQYNSNNASGARLLSSHYIPGYKPVPIGNANGLALLQGQFSLQQGPFANLGTGGLQAMIKASLGLTQKAADRFAAISEGKRLSDLHEKATQNALASTNSSDVFDPRLDPIMQSVFGITPATQANSRNVVLAAAILAMVKGYAPGLYMNENSQLYDYHNGNAGWLTLQHPAAARVIGLILEAFAAYGKSVILHVATDGGIKYGKDSLNAIGDYAPGHMGLIYALSMNGEAKMKKFHAGGFRNNSAGAAAERDVNLNPFHKPEDEGHAAFRNWLALAGVTDVTRFVPPGMTLDRFNQLNLFG